MDGGKLTVGSFDFDFTSGLTQLAIENAILIIGDYVHISGGFAFTKQAIQEVTLNDATSVSAATKRDVSVFAFGAIWFLFSLLEIIASQSTIFLKCCINKIRQRQH